MKRWNCITNKSEEMPKVDAFLEDVNQVCIKHGFCIQHEDIGGAFVIFVYTAIGGMWAVALTDFIQIIIIMIGLIVLFVVVLIDVGGWGAISPHLTVGTIGIPIHTLLSPMAPLRRSTIFISKDVKPVFVMGIPGHGLCLQTPL